MSARRLLDAPLAAALLLLLWPLVVVLRRARRTRRRRVMLHGRNGRLLFYEAERLLRGGPFAWVNHWRVLGLVLGGELAWTGPRARCWSGNEPAYARTDWIPALVSPHSLRMRLNLAHEPADETERRFIERASAVDHLGLLLRYAVALAIGSGARRRCRPGPVRLLGLRLDNHSMTSALDALRRETRTPGATQVAFVNPHCFNVASREPVYRAVLTRAPLVLADGIGVHLALKWFTGDRLLDNVNGTDLFPPLCRMAAAEGLGLFLLGGRPGVAQATARWAQQHAPGLRITGCRDGYWPRGDDAAVVDGINATRPDIVLVALGVPRQETWVAEQLAELDCGVVIGVGGLFDFYSGRIPRAPMWMRELGLEWLFRLIQEPARMWRRYLIGNFAFLWRAWRHQRGGACRRST